MPITQRRCSTCRHFQPAPLWRKGWCRNPLLYAAHQNHLVDERELDCDRQFGDYWEAIDSADGLVSPERVEAVDSPAEPPIAPVTSAAPPLTRSEPPVRVRPMAEALIDDNEVEPAPPLAASARVSTAAPRSSPRGLAAFGQRPDLMRLALPLGLIALLLVGYVAWVGWLSRTAAITPTQVASNTGGAGPVATQPAVAVTIVPEPVPTKPVSPPPTTVISTSVPVVAPTPAPASGSAPPPPAPPASATGLRPGGAAVVDTSPANDRLRLRREPGRNGVEVRLINHGQRLTVLDGPREVDGLSWWRVQYGSDTGWVAGSFIKAVA